MIDLEHLASRSRAADGPAGAGGSSRPRRAAVALAVLGTLLGLAPVVMGMFSKALAGASMLEDFTPLMTEQRLDGFSGHLRTIDDAVSELDAAGARNANAKYATFSEQWPVIEEDMSALMAKVTDNLDNYEAMAALPSFRLFPWFFLTPGAAVALIAGVVLLRRCWTRGAQVAVALVGVVLIAVPVVFGMWSRAPKGGEMMAAFRDLETTENVARIQGYFAQMAVGQGAVRREVVPALEAAGTPEQVARDFPATTLLNQQWVPIIVDMTPMIGAMSDNVDNYDAIRSMPPFAVFPWAFLLPGLLVVALAAYGGRPASLRSPVSRGEI